MKGGFGENCGKKGIGNVRGASDPSGRVAQCESQHNLIPDTRPQKKTTMQKKHKHRIRTWAAQEGSAPKGVQT